MNIKKLYRIKEINGQDTEGTFTGIASTTTEDRCGDIILAEALKKLAIKKDIVPMLFGHNSYDLESVLGTMQITGINAKNELEIQGKITLGTQSGDTAYKHIKSGALSKMSIGFIAKEYEEISEVDEYPKRYEFKEIELLEISIVPIPANNEADILEVKQHKEKGDRMKKKENENEEEVVTREEFNELAEKVKKIENKMAENEEETEEEKAIKENKDFKATMKVEDKEDKEDKKDEEDKKENE